MFYFYKRKRAFIAFILAVALLFVCACKAVPPLDNDNLQPVEFSGLSVHYLDVGQGDSILICLPDEKCALIDCGDGSVRANESIVNTLNSLKITSIDYLVLTHPDFDHIGGAKEISENFDVKKVYHPDVKEDKLGFDEYFTALSSLKEKGAQTEVSLFGSYILENYFLAFLSPKPKTQMHSSYADFILASQPTEQQINDISPYVYLEYNNVRFLFTGDNSSKQEKYLIDDYKAGIIQAGFKNKGTVNLEEIDFLKVSHHASADASCNEFLSVIKPKNAVISVGGDNHYGHPSSATLQRLTLSNPSCALWRTDVCGTISVFVSESGEISILPK